jgi:CheY-like chemotaxis protein
MARILLVDKASVFADMYQQKFISSGFDFEIATTGEEMLQKVEESKFDIILLEIMLSDGNVIESLKELRTNPLYNPELKVIVLSESTDRVIHKEVLDLGVNGFLTKLDYPPARLVDEVHRFLHQFEEQRKNAERFRNGGIPIPKNKKVLLVEDEPVFVDMFGKRLRDEGYEVEIAINGNEGFAKASVSAYDLIITDLVMSGLNGKELIDRLKEDVRTKNIPVFLFSASVDESVLNELRREGIKCFMKTHIIPSELVREVNKFLD